MTAMLRLAGDVGVSIQGYVSSARVRETPEGVQAITLIPCVVVRAQEDVERIGQLWNLAIERSPTLRLLHATLRVEPIVRVVSAV